MTERRRKKVGRAAANRKHFTEQNVLTLRGKDRQFLIWDEGTGAARGLAILVSPTGTKSYRVVYYYPGSAEPHYKHLGRVGELLLADARAAALAVRAAARRGEDPRADASAKSDNFKVAVEDYIQREQKSSRANKSALDTQTVMLANCEDWHGRPVATLRSQEIDARLELVRDGGAAPSLRGGKVAKKELKPRPYLANRLYSHLKDFFGWCVRKKKINASPMSDMRKPWDGATRRTRVWFNGAAADKAVKALWLAADEIGGDQGRYLKMMLLTGKRKSALATMRWEAIDDTWFWHAPPSQSKNKRLHPIPLPKKGQQVLHPRGESGPVFGDQTRQTLNQLQDKIRKASGLDDFFFHGVRHVLESKLAELKVAPHIRDWLFDHAPNRGSGGTYDHHTYRDEMFDALNLWAEHIDRLVQPAEGVTRLR